MKTLFVLMMALLLKMADTQAASTMSRQIVVGRQATALEQLAAKDLQRYLWQVTGTFLEIKASDEVTPGSFLLGQRETNPLIEKLTIGDLGAQGYVLKTTVVGGKPVVVIAGGDAVGCLYGVYGLLEDHFGLTFSLAQDVLPDERKSLDLPPLDERHAPSVGVRGILPWSNWPQTTTSYSWADWKSVIDQMAKMRLNLLMVHNYADELYHNVPIDGKLPRVSLPHTKTGYMIGHPAWVPWAYRFKGRDLIDDCSFGAESSLHSESFSNEEAYARGVAMFRRVIAYAHTRGVRIALGVDVNDTVKGKGKFNDAQRAKFAHEPAFVKARVDQLISDYPELDYFVAFCSEGIPQFKDTAPEWKRTINYIHQELKKRAPGIKLAISGWGQRSEYIEGIPDDVIVAPIAPYKAAAQDGSIAGKRDFWAGPWMEKDNDDSMFYMPYRVLLSATVEGWQKRSANTTGLYALTWRNTDAIDAKFWYLAHAPWDTQNKLKTARDAYHAYAVANYGREAADAVTPIINENEAFASNMCEMGGPRPFREFATIMSARHEVNVRSFRIPAAGFQVEAIKYHHRTGGGPVKAGTPNAYMQMTSGLCLEFRNVDFGDGANEIHAELASPDGARIEFRLDNADGPLLGQGVVPKTKTGEDFKTVIVPIKPTKGKQIVVINFSKEIYPRKELAKAEEQIAIVDRCMAKASPSQRQRLDLLRTRLAAVRDHIRLNLEFPEYKLEDLPGAMESWVMNYIRRVDDISSLGMMTSIQNRFVQHTYLRKKVEPFYERQAIRPPLDVEARGTAQGAEITWRETDSSGKVRGYRVYRDGQLLTKTDLPATADKFMDEGSGEFNYTVTAVGADGKESLPSVKSRCLAGSADREPPFIVMVSPPLSGLLGQPVVVKARVIDNRSYDSISATLYYRQFGSHDWQSLPMTRRVRAIFTATLTPVAGVEYYIEASDGSNTGRFPLAAPNRNLSVILENGPAPVDLATPQAKAAQRALTWTETPNAYWYRIYRGRTADFKAGPESYLTYAPKEATTFTDMEEDFDGRPREATYYYRVTAMDANGYESAPSGAVPIRSSIILPLRSATVAGRPQLVKLPEALTTMGFVLANFGKQSGDQILFKNVPPATGLRIRYSNGNAQPTQCGLYVGEKRVATLTFPVTMRGDDVDNYADGKRLTTAKGAKGDWNSFGFLDVNLPIAGQVAFRVDGDDFKANGNETCYYLDRIELTPSADVMPVTQQNAVKMQAEPFDLREVQLLESPFKRAQEINRQLLVEMGFDQLVNPFRHVAGIPSPLKKLDQGHYAYTGHTAGHYLSACALHYRNTGDVEVKKKADAVVAEMARCQEKIGTGYLGGFPEDKFGGVPWYCLHKIYAGLLDMWLLADNQQAREVLIKIADWADRYTGRMTDAAMQGMLQTEHGGICELWANLYAVTGDERHLRLAQRFVQHAAVEPFARGEDRLDNSHANTQIPKFSSVARLYQLTGNATNRLSAVNFWRTVTQNRSYVTGGNSYAEYFRPSQSYYLGSRNTESCNEYNMLKLTRYLFNVEPSAQYADYYERTLYNHVLSTKNLKTGGQLYFQPLQSGHIKGDSSVFAPAMGWRFLFNKPTPEVRSCGSEMSCCSGSGLESNAKYADSIYFHGGETDLYVNLFIPSVLNWKKNGLTVRQETRYPEQATTKLVFECQKPIALKLNLRRPWWATTEFRVLVNGAKQEITGTPGSFVPIERTWQGGDRVEIQMPMSFRVEGFKDNPNRAAVMYGPLVMAAGTEYGNPFSVIETKAEQFLDTLQPVAGKPLEFTGSPTVFRTSPVTVAEKPVVFRPLFQTFDNPCAIYWDIMNPDAFRKEAAVVQAELQRLKDMAPRTVDWVLCCPRGDESFTFQSQLLAQPGWLPCPPQQVSESAHAVKIKTGRRRNISWLVSEMFFGYKGNFCLLEPETSCAYQMKVLPDKEQSVEVLIWKSRFNENNVLLKQGTLEVVVAGQVLGKCDAASIPAGQFTKFSFPLPAELIKGKEKVEVMLRVPAKSEAVSGIYECRVVRS